MGLLKNLLVTMTLIDEEDTIGPRKVNVGPGASRILIGRSSSNPNKYAAASESNLLFESPVVSRHHAELIALPSHNEVYITDTYSMHGTWVNDYKITSGRKTLLDNDDVITLGRNVHQGSDNFGALKARIKLEWKDDESRKTDEVEEAHNTPRASNTFAPPESDSEDESDGYPSDVDGESSESLCAPTSLRSCSSAPTSREPLDLPSEKVPEEETDEKHHAANAEVNDETAEESRVVDFEGKCRSSTKTHQDEGEFPMRAPEASRATVKSDLEEAERERSPIESVGSPVTERDALLNVWATPEPQPSMRTRYVPSTVPESMPQPISVGSPSEADAASPSVYEDISQVESDEVESDEDEAPPLSPLPLHLEPGMRSSSTDFIGPMWSALDKASEQHISSSVGEGISGPPPMPTGFNALNTAGNPPSIDPRSTTLEQPSSSKVNPKGWKAKPSFGAHRFNDVLNPNPSGLYHNKYKSPYTQGPFALATPTAGSASREINPSTPADLTYNTDLCAPWHYPQDPNPYKLKLPTTRHDNLPYSHGTPSFRGVGIASCSNPMGTVPSPEKEDRGVRMSLESWFPPPLPTENKLKRKLDDSTQSEPSQIKVDNNKAAAAGETENESQGDTFPDAQPLCYTTGWDLCQPISPIASQTLPEPDGRDSKRQRRASPLAHAQTQTSTSISTPTPTSPAPATARLRTRSRGRTIARYAATALVGAVAGGVGTIATLASLPPNYFD